MARWQHLRRGLGGIAALALLVSCTAQPPAPGTKPQARPAGLGAKVAPARGPSAESLALTRFYARKEARLKDLGLMRTGGGGIDTPYTDTDLMRNFERIALHNEYEVGRGLDSRFGNNPSVLRKWVRPVRFGVEFGPSVPPETRARDLAAVRAYVARLARITGHPMSVVDSGANFHVMFMNEDERPLVIRRLRSINPNVNTATVNILETLPRSNYCVVAGFAHKDGSFEYVNALALIRAEQPDLGRLACIHEELAQGLGLANDSPRARPSVFNDDEEFALLTTHDEELLRLLYSPHLRPGMTAEQVRPILRELIAQRRSGPT